MNTLGIIYKRDNLNLLETVIKRIFDLITGSVMFVLTSPSLLFRKNIAANWWKVILGWMTVVGPEVVTREQKYQIEKDSKEFCVLEKVRPGIISESRIYMPDSKLEERMDADIQYLMNRSLLRDLCIIYDYITISVLHFRKIRNINTKK